MFAARYYPTRYWPNRYFPKVGDESEGPVVCDYVKAFTNPRLFVTDIDGNYIVASGCTAAPDQGQFVGVPAMSGIINPGNMKAVHKGSMQAIFPAGQMAGQHD